MDKPSEEIENPVVEADATPEPAQEDQSSNEIEVLGGGSEQEIVALGPDAQRYQDVSKERASEHKEPTSLMVEVSRAENDDKGTDPPKPIGNLADFRWVSAIAENSIAIAPVVDSIVANLASAQDKRGRGWRLNRIGEDEKTENEEEKKKISSYLSTANPKESMVSMLRKVVADLENTGRAYLEVVDKLRLTEGGVAGTGMVGHIPSVSVNPTKLGPVVSVSVLAANPDDPANPFTTKGWARFRLFIQGYDDKVYFKEAGDPRVVNKKDGKAYSATSPTALDLISKGRQASSLIFFENYSSTVPGGWPKWWPVVMDELSAAAAAKINNSRLNNNQIPPFLIIVTKGILGPKSLQDLLRKIKKVGVESFTEPIVLQSKTEKGSPSSEAGVEVRIEVLSDDQPVGTIYADLKSSLQADANAIYLVSSTLTGRTQDQRLATATAAVRITELQVYGPIRGMVEEMITRHLLWANEWFAYRFHLIKPKLRDPDTMAEAIARVAPSGALTAQRAHDFIMDAYGEEPEILDPLYANLPTVVFKATQKAKQGGDSLTPETIRAATCKGTRDGFDEARRSVIEEEQGPGEEDGLS